MIKQVPILNGLTLPLRRPFWKSSICIRWRRGISRMRIRVSIAYVFSWNNSNL